MYSQRDLQGHGRSGREPERRMQTPTPQSPPPRGPGSAVPPVDDTSAYPRVLLVNAQPIGRESATGITMGNLFRGWPSGRIAQIYTEERRPEESVCPHSWRLDELVDIPLPPVLRRRIAAKRVPPPHDAAHPSAGAADRDGETRSSASLESAAKETYRLAARSLPYVVPADVRRGVAAFGPDVVYSVLEEPRVVGLVLDTARQLRLPVVPHFMDDWLTTTARGPGGPLGRWRHRQLVRRCMDVLARAPVCLAIAEDMANEYAERYGREFLPFANCVDLEHRPPVVTSLDPGGVFRIGLTGSLSFARAETLVEVTGQLELLRDEGVCGEVVIYQHDPREEVLAHILESPAARLARPDEEALLQTPEARLDALLHVDTFDATAASYLRLSLSGKMPWYLAAGLPVFAYGTGSCGTMRFLAEHACAFTVERRDDRLLRNGLHAFIDGDERRRALGKRALEVVRAQFDARSVRGGFRAALAAAAGRSVVADSPTTVRG
jgi:hypothetical protein